MLKKIVFSMIIFSMSVVLSGCIDVKTELLVRKDGSGVVTETAYLSPMIEQMMQSMVRDLSSQAGGGSQPALQEHPLDIEKYKKKASQMGADVSLVSVEKVSRSDGAKGEKAIYAFKNIKNLNLNADPDLPNAGDGADSASDKDPILCDFAGGDISTLTIRMPRKAKDKKEDPVVEKPQTSETPQDPRLEASQFEQMKQMFQGFRMTMVVKVDGEIVQTNAANVGSSEASVKDQVTLFDMDIGKLISTASSPEELKKIGPKISDMGTALEKLQGIPGLIIEPSEEVVISFKGRDIDPNEIAVLNKAAEAIDQEPVSLPPINENQIPADSQQGSLAPPQPVDQKQIPVVPQVKSPETPADIGIPRLGSATITVKNGGKITGEIVSIGDGAVIIQNGASKITLQPGQIADIKQ